MDENVLSLLIHVVTVSSFYNRTTSSRRSEEQTCSARDLAIRISCSRYSRVSQFTLSQVLQVQLLPRAHTSITMGLCTGISIIIIKEERQCIIVRLQSAVGSTERRSHCQGCSSNK